MKRSSRRTRPNGGREGEAEMKLGIIAGYSPATMSVPIDLIREAEAMGYASVWAAEANGSDAVSPAAWKDAGRSSVSQYFRT